MENKIDARGKACPIPVIMAKKEADAGVKDFLITVDNKTAVENLRRFGGNNGFKTDIIEEGDEIYTISFSKTGTANNENEKSRAGSWAVFVGKEGLGQGDPELSDTLIKMYLFTLAQGDNIPDYILFMNEGVKVPVSNTQAIEHLGELKEKGTKILVCGACLNFYNLAELLKVGTVSNMYDISEAMLAVDKVITL